MFSERIRTLCLALYTKSSKILYIVSSSQWFMIVYVIIPAVIKAQLLNTKQAPKSQTLKQDVHSYTKTNPWKKHDRGYERGNTNLEKKVMLCAPEGQTSPTMHGEPVVNPCIQTRCVGIIKCRKPFSMSGAFRGLIMMTDLVMEIQHIDTSL